jgi:hypothetical protein
MLGLSEVPWAQRAKEDVAKGREAQAKAKAEDEAKRKKDAPPTHALKDYAGRFQHPAYQTLAVTQEGERLKIDLHGLTGALKHYHYDIFQVADDSPALGGTKLTFLMNSAGEIDRVAVSLEPNVKEIIFMRRKENARDVSSNE